MKLRKSVAIAICCRAWGITPHEFGELAKANKITFQEVMNQVLLEMIINPLSAEIMQEHLMPGSQKAKKKKEKDDQNNATFGQLIQLAARGKDGETDG